MPHQQTEIRKYKLYNWTSLSSSYVCLNTSITNKTWTSFPSIWPLCQWLLMWCKQNATEVLTVGVSKCLLDWLPLTPGLGYHHAVSPAAVCSSSNRQPGGDAGHGGGGQHCGDGVRARVWGDVIYLLLTAYRLSIKWAGSYGSDCRGMCFIQICTAHCAYNCVWMLWLSRY